MSKTERVAFITGCSEPDSLGAALARDLLSRKWWVFVSARKISTLEPLKALGCEVSRREHPYETCETRR